MDLYPKNWTIWTKGFYYTIPFQVPISRPQTRCTAPTPLLI